MPPNSPSWAAACGSCCQLPTAAAVTASPSSPRAYNFWAGLTTFKVTGPAGLLYYTDFSNTADGTLHIHDLGPRPQPSMAAICFVLFHTLVEPKLHNDHLFQEQIILFGQGIIYSHVLTTHYRRSYPKFYQVLWTGKSKSLLARPIFYQVRADVNVNHWNTSLCNINMLQLQF